MRSLPFFLLCGVFATAPCHGAINILIEPNALGGTQFTITQSSPGPVLSVTNVYGYAAGLDLPLSLFTAAVIGTPSSIVGAFPTPLGTLSEVYSSQTFSLSALELNSSAAYIMFTPLFEVSPYSTAQFEVTTSSPVDTPISPEAFNPGTHAISSLIFGTVTVTVIPEPSSAALIAGAGLTLLRRRRSL